MPSADLDTARANAYAIAYRLLGDRPAAHAVVEVAVERTRAAGDLDRPDWICSIAAETVAEAVGPLGGALPDGPVADGALPASGAARTDDEALRAALRRRLASASTDERVAAALHHLAGYPLEFVAASMNRAVEDVTRLVGIIAPPPGVTYQTLGDPELIGHATPTPSAAPRAAPSWASLSTILSVVVVLAVVFGASRCVGERPTLGPRPERVGVAVGPGVAARPSSGCGLAEQSPGIFEATPSGGPATTTFRLAVPAPTAPASSPQEPSGTAPRALLVAVADAGSSPAEFAEASGLERAALDAGFIVATVPSPGSGAGAEPPASGADVATAVIQQVMANRCVDGSRVTVTGLGAGGQVAALAACAQPNLIAVSAPVAGASMTQDCGLSPAVSLLLQWNADDQVMPPTGGLGAGAPAGGSAAPAMPAGRVSRDWAKAIGAGRLERTVEPDGTAIEQATAPDGAAVRSVTSPSGGHAWSPANTSAVLGFAAAHARAPT